MQQSETVGCAYEQEDNTRAWTFGRNNASTAPPSRRKDPGGAMAGYGVPMIHLTYLPMGVSHSPAFLTGNTPRVETCLSVS